MPILIKSSKGQRSCKLLNNGVPKQSAVIEDIIEALKGLTFKFEVKIADITQSEPIDDQSSQQDSVDALNSDDSPRSRPNQVEPPKLKPDSIDSPKPKPQLLPSPRPRFEPVEVPRPKSELAEAPKLKPQLVEVPKQKPQLVETPKFKPESVTTILKPDLVEKPKLKSDFVVTSEAKPKLVRGELKIGDIKTSCCIAVDDRSSPPEAYISYDDSKLYELVKVIDQIFSEIDASPLLTTVSVGEIVFAKSIDDNKWYRSIVEAINGDNIHIYFFDWGLREVSTLDRLKHLFYPDAGLSKFPACALKLRFTNTPSDMLDQILSCEAGFKMVVESYNDATECYEVKALELVNN